MFHIIMISTKRRRNGKHSKQYFRCISFAEFGPNTFTKQLVVIGLDDGLALRITQAIV